MAVLAAASLPACRGAAQPAAAVSPSPVPSSSPVPPSSARAAADTGRTGYSAADVAFMQGMIGHHAQALTMTALVPTRGGRDDIRLLAERIRASQVSEIAQMRQWLLARGEAAPAADEPHPMAGMHGADHARMPGMATEEEMARLAAASGAEFDRLFLELMIRHHEGALTMVADLFATNGAGQEPELFRLASDVDADQRAEIARMRRLLGPQSPQ
jgi:uncharacterized protein (DUF305 family)